MLQRLISCKQLKAKPLEVKQALGKKKHTNMQKAAYAMIKEIRTINVFILYLKINKTKF